MKQKRVFKSIAIAVIIVIMHGAMYSQILITEDSGGGTTDESAILQIDSDSKGVLIPRITTANRLLISAVEGLLVYDSDEGSFYLYSSSGWTNLSSSTSEIWTKDASNVYLINPDDNIGIGTSPSSSKFVVQANSGSLPDDILFEVKDDTGVPVFRVTSEGVRIYVKDKTQTKGVSGGFAVGQYGSLKDIGDEYLIVTADSTRVYTLPSAKGVSGGFAVGQYSSLKGGATIPNFYTNPGETKVYTGGAGKGVSGGFAVGQYGSLKGTADDYMHMTPDNYFIGHSAGLATLPLSGGVHNIFVGYESGLSNTTGHENTYVGHLSGRNQVWGIDNVFLGNGAGQGIDDGVNRKSNRNVVIGVDAGKNIGNAIDNVFIGHNAGIGSGTTEITGDYNIIIGEGAGNSIASGAENVIMGNLAGANNSSGSNNVFLGYNSGKENTTGTQNTFIGSSAGSEASGGTSNVFMGVQTGMYHSLGDNNVYLGNAAGMGSTIVAERGASNVFIGFKSGMHNTTGTNNVFMGENSGLNHSTGRDNVFIGNAAGMSSSGGGTGSNNVFVGTNAGTENIDGINNVILGTDAGYKNNGDYNVFIGYESGYNNINGDDPFNRFSKYNTFVGYKSGKGNTTGWSNIAIGFQAGLNNQTATNQFFIGNNSGENLSFGYGNTFVGHLSGTNSVGTDIDACDKNTFIGYQTGYNNLNGDYNVYLGYTAGLKSTGSSNTFIGHGTGYNETGSGNVYLGNNVGYTARGSNLLYIDNSNASAPLIWGNFSDGNEKVQINGTLDVLINDIQKFIVDGNGGVSIGSDVAPPQDGLYVTDNLGINATLFGKGHQVFAIGNGTAPVVSIADGVLLYAEDVSLKSELKVRDEVGNVTTLSPHNFSLIEKSEPMAWSFYSKNSEIGQTINVDMLRTIRLVEQISGEKLVYFTDLEGNVIESDNVKKEKTREMKVLIQNQNMKIEILEKQIQELKKLIQNK